MSDLVKNLRNPDWVKEWFDQAGFQAADRIDELEAKLAKLKLERNYANDVINSYVAQVSDLEAKLAKAVETISLCRKMQAQFAHREDPLMVLLDTTLAELKG